MSKEKRAKVVVVIRDGTVDVVYADTKINLVVAEPDLIADDLCDYVWPPIICDLKSMRISEDLREEIDSALQQGGAAALA